VIRRARVALKVVAWVACLAPLAALGYRVYTGEQVALLRAYARLVEAGERIGDLAGIGRDALKRRFRKSRSPAANTLLRLDQLLGRLPERHDRCPGVGGHGTMRSGMPFMACAGCRGGRAGAPGRWR